MSQEEINRTDDRTNPDTDTPGPGPPQPPVGPPPPPPTGGCVPKVRRVLNSRGGYSICRKNNKRVTGCGPGGLVCPISNLLTPTPTEIGCFAPGTPYGSRFRVTHTVDEIDSGVTLGQGSPGAYSYHEGVSTVQPGRAVVEFATAPNPDPGSPRGDCVIFQSVIEDVPLTVNWVIESSGDGTQNPIGENLNFSVVRHTRLTSAILSKVLRTVFDGNILAAYGWPIGTGSRDPQELRSCAAAPGGPYEIDSRLFSRGSIRVPNGWGVGDGLSGFGLSHSNIFWPNTGDCNGSYDAAATFGDNRGPHPVFDFWLPDGRQSLFPAVIPSGATAPGTYSSSTTGTSQQCEYEYSYFYFTANFNGIGRVRYAETWSWEVIEPCVPVSQPRKPGVHLPPGINPETMQPYTQPGRCQGCGQ